MKFNKAILSVPLLSVLVFLLVCLLISVLYAFDLFSTHFYEASCLFTGCMLYLMTGILFFRCIKKRQLAAALMTSILIFSLQMYRNSFTQNLLQDSLKLLFFLGAVVFMQLRRQS